MSRQEEKLILPEPLKVKPSIAKYLDKLEINNSSNVFAKGFIDNKTGYFYFGYQIGGNWWGSDEDKEKKKRFLLKPGFRGSGWNDIGIETTYKPEFFYTIKVLPQGKYYFSRIQALGMDRFLYKKDSMYYFDVKAGYVNYLGDFYLSSPERSIGFWDDSYTLNTLLLDKSKQAKDFITKFHPEIKLPFITNLILRKKK